jgi:hypothetical protein
MIFFNYFLCVLFIFFNFLLFFDVFLMIFVGDLDRVGGEIESRAMACRKQWRSKWERKDTSCKVA